MNNNILYPYITAARLRMEADGDGVTTLVAGAGCPLRCQYCLNKKVLAESSHKMITVAELYEILKVDDLYFQATGGGVTFGGGESLLHAEFIASFREYIGDKWKIYVESSLHVPPENIITAAKAVDYFIVDIKTLNPEIYEAYTACTLNQALDNLKLLLTLVSPEKIRVRVPLIPSYNDEVDQENTQKLLTEMGVKTIEKFNYVIK